MVVTWASAGGLKFEPIFFVENFFVQQQTPVNSDKRVKESASEKGHLNIRIMDITNQC